MVLTWFLAIGLLEWGCLTSASEPSDFDDVINILNNKYSPSSNVHKYKKSKLQNGHEALEMSFPMFSDLFPLTGLEGKSKEPLRSVQDDKDPFFDGGDLPKLFRPKKKAKDKFIMSFTEFFIPIMNHKNLDMGMPKKLDIFDEFFKDFPLRDLDEPPMFHRHKIQKKNLVYGPFSNKSQPSTDYYLLDYTTLRNYLLGKKNDTLNKYDYVYDRSPEAAMYLSSIENDTETVPMCCAGHAECKMKLHCQQGMCKDEKHDESYERPDISYLSKMTEVANISKLSRNILFYTVPILIGVGGIIVAIEVIRKHNGMIRQAQYLKEYDAVQHC